MSKKKQILTSIGIGGALAALGIAMCGIKQIPENKSTTTQVVEQMNDASNVKLAFNSVNESEKPFIEVAYSNEYDDNYNFTDGETFNRFGVKYIYDYTYSRFLAYTSETASKDSTIALPCYIFGKSVTYLDDNFDLSSYTAIENLVLFERNSIFESAFTNRHIKNIYVASSFNFLYIYTTLTCDNLYYCGVLAGYKGDPTNVNNYPDRIVSMGAKHMYYFSFQEGFFDLNAQKWEEKYPDGVKWEKLDETECAFAKESFYPCKDFVPDKTGGGLYLWHSSISSSYPVVKTHTDLKYDVITFDDRIKSITIGEDIAKDDIIYENETFEMVDIRYVGLGVISGWSAKKMVLGNTDTTLNGSYIKNGVEEIYFVKNQNSNEIVSTVTEASGISASKIYIPETDKEYFQGIIDNSTLNKKIEYYDGNITVDLAFTDGTNDILYKVKNPNVDIDLCLSQIPRLELNEIELTSGVYLDEALHSINLPTTIEEASKNYMDKIYITNDADIEKLFDRYFIPLVYTQMGLYQEPYDISYTYINNTLKYTITFEDGTSISKTALLTIIESEIPCISFFSSNINRILLYMDGTSSPTVDITKDILTSVLKEVSQVSIAPIFDSLDISVGGTTDYKVSVEDTIYTADIISTEDSFKAKTGTITDEEGNEIAVKVEDQAESIQGYHIITSIYFTDGFKLEEVLKACAPYVLYKDGTLVDSTEYNVKFSVSKSSGLLNISVTNKDDEVISSVLFEPYMVTNTKNEFIYLEAPGQVGHLIMNPTSTKASLNDIYQTAFCASRITLLEPTISSDMALNKCQKSDVEIGIYQASNGKYYNYYIQAEIMNIAKAVEESAYTVEIPEGFEPKIKEATNGLVGEKEEVTIGEANSVEDIFNNIKDKLENNPALKTLAIVLGSILGLGILWLFYKLIRKIIKWLK